MQWSSFYQYPYESGALFLGRCYPADDDQPSFTVGIKTERHALTIAGAGAGKGVAVIIPNLLRWPHNALVIDPKGEAAAASAEAREALGQDVHILDPFRIADVPDRFRASYNPLDEIDADALTIREDIEAISDGIVMRSDPSASHWDDGAQSLISGLIAYVLDSAPPEKRNLLEVRRILNDDTDGGAFDLALEAMSTRDGCAGLMREGYGTARAKEGGYHVSNARKNTRWLDSRGMANALASSSFSLSALKQGKATIFLVLPANYLGQHGRFLRLFVRSGIEAMARPTSDGKLRGEQCLFLLDEFYSLGRIDEIAKAAGLMRGYGLQLWPILQDLGQLIELYGKEGSETFFANADLHQFFGNTDQLTLEQISTRLGVRDLSEMPLPPSAPKSTGVNFGRGISGLTSGSKKGINRVAGAAIGGAFSLAQGGIESASQADYQNGMNIYNRAMQQYGQPRMTVDEVANRVRKKDGVVADSMICFVFGRDRLAVGLVPFFDEIEEGEEGEEKETPKAPKVIAENFFIYKYDDGDYTFKHKGRFALFSFFGFIFALWGMSQNIGFGESLLGGLLWANAIGFFLYRIVSGRWTE